MDKRYQVFISSTFQDLQNARQEVSQALLRADCFPAGMELFPAADEEQFEFIKTVIDQSDYYILISAGRYGSIHPSTGLSYTEMEYDYAVEAGKPIIRLLHKDPFTELRGEFIEKTDKGRNSLKKFRKKLSERRLVAYWSTPEQLQLEATLALRDLQKKRPTMGWVRGALDLVQDSYSDKEPGIKIEAPYDRILEVKNRLLDFDPFGNFGFHFLYSIEIGKANDDTDRGIGEFGFLMLCQEELLHRILISAYVDGAHTVSNTLEHYHEVYDPVMSYEEFLESASIDSKFWTGMTTRADTIGIANEALEILDLPDTTYEHNLELIKLCKAAVPEPLYDQSFVFLRKYEDMHVDNSSGIRAIVFLEDLGLLTTNEFSAEQDDGSFELTRFGERLARHLLFGPN